MVATFGGRAVVPTHFYLFTETRGDIAAALAGVPAFEGRAVVRAGAEQQHELT